MKYLGISAAPSWPRGERGTAQGASPRTPERAVLAPSIQRCAGSFCPLFLAPSVDCCVSRSSLTGWKVACHPIRAHRIPSYMIWPFGEVESEWLFGMCQCVSDARRMFLAGRRIPGVGSCAEWEGGACSEGWRAPRVRFVRLGEPCGASRPGWGGWSNGGVTPLRGCVSGGDWADVVGVWRGCQGWGGAGLFAAIWTVWRALLPS